MRFKKDGHWHNDFGLFREWCNQTKNKPSDPNVLSKFIEGLPLYRDGFGDLYLESEIDVAYSLKYGSYYNEKMHELTNCTIAECLVSEIELLNDKGE